MAGASEFLFVVCQHGAQAAVKAEFAANWPAFRFAYSRPGFVTFKLPADESIRDDVDLRSTFCRTFGFSLGKAQSELLRENIEQFWQVVGDQTFHQLHVWQRDTALPGDRGFEPGVTPLADEISESILRAAPRELSEMKPNQIAQANQTVLDCILVEPNQWWIGRHRATSIASRWVGGICPVRIPSPMVSRAYLKIVEALEWSKLPTDPGDVCVEIGSAPGGASQALLERELKVIGVDPAEMDPVVLEHPNFVHVRKRGIDVARREFRDAPWLITDLNVAPNYTLEMVEDIVSNGTTKIRGMLLTLKLPDWKLAQEIPNYIERVRSWGFSFVKTRQLAFNRQEICLMALRQRALRRFGR